MSEQASGESSSSLPWRGFHHIALVTRNLGETIRFYRDVLGMQAGEISTQTARGTGQRHLFITPGETKSWGLHIFENVSAKSETATLREKLATMEVGMQHLAFTLPDENVAKVLRQRLHDYGVEMTPVRTLGPICNTLFLDNNGLLLEATWPASENDLPNPY